MSEVFDVAVLGMGANGSAALYHLAKTGRKVIGIDRFSPPHTKGSSHGQSRIIRQAYHENPLYVPLVKAAYERWAEIEAESGRQLFLKTGGIMIGSENSGVITGSRLSAETYGIPFEMLGAAQTGQRFPGLKPAADMVGLLEYDAGILFPEAAIEAFLGEARKHGAVMRTNERALVLRPGRVITIVTDAGVYQAKQLIVSTGAWMNELLPELRLPLRIERQVLFWFKDKTGQKPALLPDRLPVYIWEYAPGQMFYGFPDLGDGIKIAYHHAGEEVIPGGVVAGARPEEIEVMRRIAATYLDMNPEFGHAVTCMYTNTPDEHFIIDRHPQHENILVASPCSGHGFKFSALTGKILADMALDVPVSFDLSPFRISRFNGEG